MIQTVDDRYLLMILYGPYNGICYCINRCTSRIKDVNNPHGIILRPNSIKLLEQNENILNI